MTNQSLEHTPPQPRPDLDDLGRRGRRHWNVDGLPELVMGLMWIIWGGAWLAGQTLEPGGRTAMIYWTVVPILLALSGFASGWLLKRLKARLTIPRAGYAGVREATRSIQVVAAAVAIVLFVTVGFLVLQDGSAVVNGPGNWSQRAPQVLGVILGLTFVAVSVRQRAPRFLVLAAVAITLGLTLDTAGNGWLSTSWFFVGLGIASVATGGIRLARFLRAHPPANVETA